MRTRMTMMKLKVMTSSCASSATSGVTGTWWQLLNGHGQLFIVYDCQTHKTLLACVVTSKYYSMVTVTLFMFMLFMFIWLFMIVSPSIAWIHAGGWVCHIFEIVKAWRNSNTRPFQAFCPYLCLVFVKEISYMPFCPDWSPHKIRKLFLLGSFFCLLWQCPFGGLTGRGLQFPSAKNVNVKKKVNTAKNFCCQKNQYCWS